MFGFEGMTFRRVDFVEGKTGGFSKVRRSRTFFLDSSMVEHSAVNRVVVGSSPTRGGAVKASPEERKKERNLHRGDLVRESKKEKRLRGQAVKTSPFHGGNTGSIPVGVIF